MSKMWDPLPKTLGAPKQHILDVFRRFDNLTANLTAYIFGTKLGTDNRGRALETTEGLLQSLNIS